MPRTAMMQTMQLTVITIFLLLIVCSINCKDNQNSKESKPGFAPKSSLDSSDLNKLAVDYEHGKSLFKEHCNTCHFAPEKKITDQFIFDNLFKNLPQPSEEYFIKFIQDSKQLKSSGDKYAQELSKNWNSDYEHFFKDDLMPQDFNDLIIYIKVAAKQKNK